MRKRAVQHDAEKGQNEIAHDGAFRHFRLAENREVLKQVHQENPDEMQKIIEIPSLFKIFPSHDFFPHCIFTTSSLIFYLI